jgi:hypothetical protein
MERNTGIWRKMMKNVIILLIVAIAIIGVGASIEWYSENPAGGLPDIQAGQSETGSAFAGGFGSDWTSAQDQLFGRKLKCSIWTDNDIYMVEDRINLYYKVNRPCYVKIIINRPDGESTIGPTWKNTGTYSIPGRAKEPYGDREVSLKAWTKTKPQQVCRSSCSYAIGFEGLRSPVSYGSTNSFGENAEQSDGYPESYDEFGEPSDEYAEQSDGSSEPSDEYGEPQ